MASPPPGHDVGCDVVAVDEVRRSLGSFGDRYLRRSFTPGEVADAGGDPARLAARFAAKEAVHKLFREPEQPLPFTQVEVVLLGGLPGLRLHGTLAQAAGARWDELSVTLSHTDCHAMAVVLARRRPVGSS